MGEKLHGLKNLFKKMVVEGKRALKTLEKKWGSWWIKA